MVWSVSPFVAFFSLIVYGVLFLVVATSRPHTPPKKAFCFYLLAMFFWSFSAFITLSGAGNSLFWFRLMVAGAIASMPAIFYFVQTFLNFYRPWASFVYLYSALCILLALLSPFVVQSASVSNGAVSYQFTPLLVIVAGPGYGLALFSLVLLFHNLHISKDAIYRNRLRYLAIGLAFIILGSLVNWTPLGRYPIDIAANGLCALFIAYAILKHQLLDISVVLRKGLLYSIPTSLIGAAYFLIISLALNLLHLYSSSQIFLLSLFVAILTALVAQPLHAKIQGWVDRLFFREKYDATRLIQRLSHTTASLLDLNLLTSFILNEITATLHINRAAFFLRQSNGDFYLAAQHGLSLTPAPALRHDHPLALYLATYDHALNHENMDILPQFKALWYQERLDLDHIAADIFIPLKAQNELLGILALGPKLSEQPYTYDDQLNLLTLASQTAIAIKNALLYDAELSRREELDALYTLTRQLLDTNDTESVLDRIVHNSVQSAHVTFATILTFEDNTFVYRASFLARALEHEIGKDTFESPIAQRYYRRAFHQRKIITLVHNELTPSDGSWHELFRDQLYSLCISPLQVGEQPIGILILGEARSAIREPFDADKLRLISAISDQAASALHRAKLHEQLEENFVQTILALANAMDARDTYTHGHSQRLADLAEATLREISNDEEQIRAIRWAALLHDIGKIGVADEILRKPGPLTPEEWVVMKQHPEIGAKIVQPVKQLANVAPLIRSHHEKYDGTGYPYGLKGKQIPLGARVLTVIDAYSAMIDDRVYRKAMSHDEAIEELKRCTHTQFDPTVVEVFLRVLETHQYKSTQLAMHQGRANTTV